MQESAHCHLTARKRPPFAPRLAKADGSMMTRSTAGTGRHRRAAKRSLPGPTSRHPDRVYSLLLCSLVALVFAIGGLLLDFWPWGWAIAIAVVVFIVAWVLLARRLGHKLQPAMTRVQKQMEASMFDAAMQSLEELLPMSRWVPMLRGQLLAQMGLLAYHAGDKDKAVKLLEGASMRAPDARLLLEIGRAHV